MGGIKLQENIIHKYDRLEKGYQNRNDIIIQKKFTLLKIHLSLLFHRKKDTVIYWNHHSLMILINARVAKKAILERFKIHPCNIKFANDSLIQLFGKVDKF